MTNWVGVFAQAFAAIPLYYIREVDGWLGNACGRGGERVNTIKHQALVKALATQSPVNVMWGPGELWHLEWVHCHGPEAKCERLALVLPAVP